MPVLFTDLAKQLHVTLPPPFEGKTYENVLPLDQAGPRDLSFLDNPKYTEQAKTTKAGFVLTRPEHAALLPQQGCSALTTQNPYAAFAIALQLLHPKPAVQPGISQFAVVSSSATIHPTARIEPYAVIYANVTVGEGAHIHAHAVLGDGVKVGAHSVVGAHCSLLKTTIGSHSQLHPGVRTGQDGFGFAFDKRDGIAHLIKVPQVGNVVIGNHVEIGAGTTIDCGAMANTIIEDQVKIDNQVQIGHNAHIGAGTRIVAQTGISGSAKIGMFTVIGGQSGVAGHLSIADGVMVAARSGVTKSIPQAGAVVAGLPAIPINEWRRQSAAVARLAKGKGQHKALAVDVPAQPTLPAGEDTETPADPNTANPFA